jgi:hypothetical protein
MSKINFTPELLQEIVKRDNAILIGNYEKTTRDSKISFNCSCGKNNNKKLFRSSYNYGLFCKNCINKKANEKSQSTSLVTYGTKHPNQNIEMKEKYFRKVDEEQEKKENEKNKKESKLRKWRDNIVKSVDVKKISETEWLIHPIHQNYAAQLNSNVKNIKTNKLIGSENKVSGYSRIPVNPTIFRHRFLLECVYKVQIPFDYDIDHIDKDSKNNNFNNLQILTRKEHNQKTCDTNPHIGKCAGEVNANPVECTFSENNGEVKIIKFNSLVEAMDHFKISKTPIINSINNNKEDSCERKWSYTKENIDNEKYGEWRSVPGLENCKASSEGYILNENGNDNPRLGTKNVHGYMCIKLNKKEYKVHQLVCKAFHGLPPGENFTVDHIDRNRQNNKSSNLKWEDKKGQAANRDGVKEIEVYSRKTLQQIEKFRSVQDFVEKYKIAYNTAWHILTLNKKNYSMSSTFGNNLSIRYSNLSLKEKKERELQILEHNIFISNLPNKRKNNSEEYPNCITKRENNLLYRFNMKFIGEKIDKTFSKLEDAIQFKKDWMEEKIKKRKEIIESYNE